MSDQAEEEMRDNDRYEKAEKEGWSANSKAPYCARHSSTGKTVAELSPEVGSRWKLTPNAGREWWEVKKVVKRGVVIELWGEHGHLTLWESDMFLYPV